MKDSTTQGSVLGLLLFNTNMKGIPKLKYRKIVEFADDTIFYTHSRRPGTPCRRVTDRRD